jgi:hypothetical protein
MAVGTDEITENAEQGSDSRATRVKTTSRQEEAQSTQAIRASPPAERPWKKQSKEKGY